MGSSTIQWALRPVVKYHLRRGVGLIKFLKMVLDPSSPPLLYNLSNLYLLKFRKYFHHSMALRFGLLIWGDQIPWRIFGTALSDMTSSRLSHHLLHVTRFISMCAKIHLYIESMRESSLWCDTNSSRNSHHLWRVTRLISKCAKIHLL